MSHNPASPLFVRNFKKPVSRRYGDPKFQSWRQGFSNLAIEVGCGVGFHPIHWAKSHPETGLIALERTKNKFASFEGRVQNHPGLKNLFPVGHDGRLWIPDNIEDAEVSQYFFIYPNPYPKAAQANKRWHRNPLMHYLMGTLKDEGTLTFATNELWLKEECLLYMLEFWKTKLLSLDEVRGPQPKALSHFEKKYLAQGQTCYHLVFQKGKS